MPGPGIKVSKPVRPVSRTSVPSSEVASLLKDKNNRSSSTDNNVHRPEQELMNESLQVPHPFEKGKTIGWGEFKRMAKTHASQFRDAGINDIPTYQQTAYNTALKNIKEFPAAAVDKYQATRSAEAYKNNTVGIVKKPLGSVVAGGTPVYNKGTMGIKVKPKGKC